MSFKHTQDVLVLSSSLLLGFVAAFELTGCGDAGPGISRGGNAGEGGALHQGGASSISGSGSVAAGKGGRSDSGAGSGAEGGEAGEAESGAAGDATGGTAAGGTIENGSGGNHSSNAGSDESAAGQGDTNEAMIPPACWFRSDALPAGGAGGSGGAPGAGGAGGTGGAAGAAGTPPTITVQVSPFVGNYLADAAGRSLYTYGADLPGDCQNPPVSTCVTDCLLTWPILPAGQRILAPGLDDAAFGALHRADGTWQTTYYGWPLYYYKTDLLLGQVAGQGKGKTWHLAQQKPPGVVIMKVGTTKFLGDAEGHTLYVSAADQTGTASADPVSNCSGTCLATFEPFREKNFSVVTSLLIADFASFVRHGKGGVQVAYKGQPLYRAATDLKAGDMTGVVVSGFTAALP